MQQLAEEILLDHRRHGHAVYLFTSMVGGEGVTDMIPRRADWDLAKAGSPSA